MSRPVQRSRLQKPAQKLSIRRAATKRAPRTKWVYLFDEGDASMKALLGGKGANLAEMTKLGLPVPPGLIVTTEACNAYLASDGFPPGLWDQVTKALARVEKADRQALRRSRATPSSCPAVPAPSSRCPA